jgi:transcriptional regulator with GAF, ATPase, and Fis domain
VSGSNNLSLLLASNNDSLANELIDAGLNISRSSDGFETIRMAIESNPDAVILDCKNNGLPPPSVAIWLKLNPSTHSLPVIGLNGGEMFWQEAVIDAEIPYGDSIDNLVSITEELVRSKRVLSDQDKNEIIQDFDPLDITLDLISTYRERLGLASAMIELASLQHDLGNFEYTIKSILEVTGHAIGSKLVALTLIRGRSHYILVRGNDSCDSDLVKLEDYSISRLNEYMDKPVEIDDQLVFGRRKVNKNAGNPEIECNFFGHPIYSSGKTLGYLSGICTSDHATQHLYDGLLSDLTAQIALLLVNTELIETHDSYVGELSNVLRAVVEVSSISPLSETTSKGFLLQFLLIVLELCNTNKGCVILYDSESEEIEDVAALGVDENEILSSRMDLGKSLIETLPELPKSEVHIDSATLGHGKISRLVVPLAAGEKIMGGLVVLGFPVNLSPRIIKSVTTLATLAGYFLDNRALHQHCIKTSIMEDQLKFAREIQLEMLPDGNPEYPGYDIFGCSIPAKEVGGDFFDYLRQDGLLGIAVADVCGKSIPASLLMTMTRALVLSASESHDHPNEVMQSVNALLTRIITRGKFVTSSLLYISEDNIDYASAGHQPLLVYRAASDEFEEVDPDGVALGIVGDMDFEHVNFKMNGGDIALMFTDGLNEAMNLKREQFGYENIRTIIRSNSAKGAQEIVDTLFNAIRNHAGGADQFDDTTIVIIKKIKEGNE